MDVAENQACSKFLPLEITRSYPIFLYQLPRTFSSKNVGNNSGSYQTNRNIWFMSQICKFKSNQPGVVYFYYIKMDCNSEQKIAPLEEKIAIWSKKILNLFIFESSVRDTPRSLY